MLINREGGKIIVAFLFSFVAITLMLYYFVLGCRWCGWLSYVVVLFCVILTLVALFFREPNRQVECDERFVYAPCDGRVVVTELVHESEYLNEEMMQISIFMSVTNIHVNWLAVGGVVEYFKHHHGRYLIACNPKSSELNERTTTVIACDSGAKVILRQVAGYVARRIVNYVSVGERVNQCDRLGFIKFGSRVDILLPKSAEVLVELGERTIGAKSVIAKF